ncbi:MAG: response regulator transcription factor [Dehalococcoidia bacterium]|nr:response regulator transcription factor [Dehalococcoidia bacterium]
MSPSKIKVLVADDHPAFLEGICRLLADESDIDVVARSSDGEAAVKMAKLLQPDVVVLDVAMPKLNGIEAAKQIKAACPNTAIILLSAYEYESYLLAALNAGATGYLVKNAPVRNLISAVRSAHSGQAVFDLKVAGRVLRNMSQDGREERKEAIWLQPREVQVLKLAAKGMSNKEIAQKLVVSERTVQSHLVNIFRKLAVGSRTEAVLRALKQGWLIPDDLP